MNSFGILWKIKEGQMELQRKGECKTKHNSDETDE